MGSLLCCLPRQQDFDREDGRSDADGAGFICRPRACLPSCCGMYEALVATSEGQDRTLGHNILLSETTGLLAESSSQAEKLASRLSSVSEESRRVEIHDVANSEHRYTSLDTNPDDGQAVSGGAVQLQEAPNPSVGQDGVILRQEGTGYLPGSSSQAEQRLAQVSISERDAENMRMTERDAENMRITEMHDLKGFGGYVTFRSVLDIRENYDHNYAISSPADTSDLVDDEEMCSICLEGYDYENPKINANCSHYFHLSCILGWKERSNLCPVCQQEMLLEEFS